MKMDTEKAIEFLQKELIEATINWKIREGLIGIQDFLKTQQELITKLSSEVEEQQKNLDQIDLWAMEIQMLIKKIRGKI